MDGTVNVAVLRFREFISFLNGSAFIQRNPAKRMTPKILDDLLAHAMPVNPNGTINLREVCAWLACREQTGASGEGNGDRFHDKAPQGSGRYQGRVQIDAVLSATAELCSTVSILLSELAGCDEYAFPHLHNGPKSHSCGSPLAGRVTVKGKKSKRGAK